ncbi:MAG TPA: hypothetical protein VMM79_10040 [Longimicrobiales bacterium]|nr:hypothetical protein [Longimicrobiales bacterium]
MERFRFITVALLGLCFLPVPGRAQDGSTGARSVSLMGGTFSGAFNAARNVPMLASRYRVRTARLVSWRMVRAAARTYSSASSWT